MNVKHVFHSIQIETDCKATSTDTVELINTSLEKDVKNTDKCTEFKTQSIDMSSEYCKDSEVVEVSFEKGKDIVDCGTSVEQTGIIEVGTDIFGESAKIFIDSLTDHEATSAVDIALTEFSCQMVDGESYLERKYIEQGSSHVGQHVVEVSTELFTTIKYVDCSSEFTIDMSETLVEQSITTCDVGVETEALAVVDESTSIETTYCTVECDTSDSFEEIVKVEEHFEESQLPTLEHESISSEITFIDKDTTAKVTLADISSQMEVDHVEHSSEWSKITIHESEVFETEKTTCLTTLTTSDNQVQYCTIDIQFEQAKPKTFEYGYETKCRIVEAQSDYEVNFKFRFFKIYQIDAYQ